MDRGRGARYVCLPAGSAIPLLACPREEVCGRCVPLYIARILDFGSYMPSHASGFCPLRGVPLSRHIPMAVLTAPKVPRLPPMFRLRNAHTRPAWGRWLHRSLLLHYGTYTKRNRKAR